MKSSPKQSCSGLFVGLAAVDISYAVEDIPRPNQKISVPEQLVTAGGPATNAAATFAFLGGRATLVTAVGRNLLSRIIRDDLAHHSVRLHNMAGDCDGPPPVSSIMVLRRTGERSVVSANAAVFSPIKKAFDPKWLAGVSILEVDGQYMPLCIAAAKAASERNIPVVLDSGSWKPGMARLLRFVDTAICSGDFRPPGCRSEDEAFEYLVSHKMRRVAITRGERPIRYYDDGITGEIRIPSPQRRAVDTLGAGDIAHGAYCYYSAQSQGFRDALQAAARVATFSCRYRGTRQWMKNFHP